MAQKQQVYTLCDREYSLTLVQVKLVTCMDSTLTLWYAKHIGETFWVAELGRYNYMVKEGEYAQRVISKQDCEII